MQKCIWKFREIRGLQNYQQPEISYIHLVSSKHYSDDIDRYAVIVGDTVGITPEYIKLITHSCGENNAHSVLRNYDVVDARWFVGAGNTLWRSFSEMIDDPS